MPAMAATSFVRHASNHAAVSNAGSSGMSGATPRSHGAFLRSFLSTSNLYSPSWTLIYAVFFSTANITGAPRPPVPPWNQQRYQAHPRSPSSLSPVVSVSFTDESVPGPVRDAQPRRHIVCRVGVGGHRRSGRPRKVIVQHASEALVAREPGIFQGLIETRDRPLVHLLVRSVATVRPDDRGLVTILVGVGAGPTECLRPVRGKALGVLRMVSVAERMAHHVVLEHPGVPRAGQP